MTLPASWFRVESHLIDGSFPNLVGDSWLPPQGTETEPQWNPSTGAQTGSLRYASVEDVDAAVAQAWSAQAAWAARPLEQRLAWLEQLKDEVRESRVGLVDAIATETGKTSRDATDELRIVEGLLSWLADPDLWKRRAGLGGSQARRLPHGVFAGISLYHYPLLSALWMLAPAVAAGNTFVLRPCTWSPAIGVMLCKLVQGAGLPDGVVNMVQGGIEVVDRLLDHPSISGVSYVGSGPWAFYMYRRGSEHGKRVQAMGALRQVHVVLPTAQLDEAASAIVHSVVRLAGQRWLAGTSVIAAPAVADALIQRLAVAAATVAVGPAGDPATELGPVVRQERRSDLESRIADAAGSGTLVADGRVAPSEPGFYVGPTVIDGVTTDSALWRDEVPGPLISVLRSEVAHVEEMLSTSVHGLVGSVYGAEAQATAERLPFSIAAANSEIPELSAGVPWAAWPPGFFGTSHWNGPEQLDFVTRTQVIGRPGLGELRRAAR